LAILFLITDDNAIKRIPIAIIITPKIQPNQEGKLEGSNKLLSVMKFVTEVTESRAPIITTTTPAKLHIMPTRPSNKARNSKKTSIIKFMLFPLLSVEMAYHA